MRNENTQELIDLGMNHQVARAKKYKSPEASPNDLCDHYDHGGEESRRFWASLDRFLMSRVGQPHDKVYSEFCAKWPAWIGRWTDTRWAFRNECNLEDPGRSYNDFIIDENGILQKNPKSWRWRRRDKKTVVIGSRGPGKTRWIFNKDWFRYKDIEEYLIRLLGWRKVMDIKESDYIPESIVRFLDIRKGSWHSWEWFFMNHKKWDACGQWVYRKVEKDTTVRVEKGTSQYSRVKAEGRDATRKIWRENRRQKEQIESVLLHDLEQKAKEKERAQNEVDRDRLGFDSQSFIGEPYHGQKRKKNKRN